jgi:hypothetical protein
MKLNFPAVFIALASIGAGLLSLPAIAQDDFWVPPPLDQIGTAAPRGGHQPGSRSPEIGPLTTKITITSPTTQAALKGIVEVKIAGLEKGGFVIFRLDDAFAYATAYPYTMRWDTQGAEDGKHVIRVNAYAPNGRMVGVTSQTVEVKNRLPVTGEGGVSLGIRPPMGGVVVRDMEATSTVAGLGGDTVLPGSLLGLKSRLFARIGQSISSVSPGGPAEIRSTLRQGNISADNKSLPFPEKGFYGIFTQSPSGLAIPPSPESQRPRIGLAEISLEAPPGKVAVGTTWVAPMRVVPDLVRRNSIQVMGTHTFEGLWWRQNRRCARISSSYEIGEVALAGGASSLEGTGAPQLENVGDLDTLTNSTADSMMSAGSGADSGIAGIFGEGGSQPQAAGTATPPVSESKTLTEQEVARLTGLTGSRTTWIDIDKGVVVRIEDAISGTFAFGSSGKTTTADSGEAFTASMQRLPYSLNLTLELAE